MAKKYQPPKDLPPKAQELYGQANTLLELNRAPEAEKILVELCKQFPDRASVWGLLGVCFYDQLRFENAYDAFINIAQKADNKAYYAFKTGFLELLSGDYRRGWQLYMQRHRHPLPLPLLGTDNMRTFKHLLVLREQGYGDIIQFVRFLHPLRNYFPNRKITFLCPPPMMRLMQGLAQDLNINLIYELNEENIAQYGFDAYTHLCSLPIHLGMQKEHIGLIGNFFTYDKQKAQKIRDSLPKPAIGFCWAGRKGYPRFYNRDLPNEDAEYFFSAFPDIKFISLMKPDVELPDQVKNLYGHAQLEESLIADVQDFYDLATLIAAMDCLVTVDSAPLHVSATLGKPTYSIIGYAPDWRWLMGQTDSFWYPSCSLFRQTQPGEWRTVVQDVIEELSYDMPKYLEQGQ